MPIYPRLTIASKPKILLVLSILRAGWIPLYLLCNIQRSEGPATLAAKVRSDLFYLLLVQLPFGLTNGYVGSCCMMGANVLVADGEKEAAGGFMGLMLVSGLTVGSLASFFIGNRV